MALPNPFQKLKHGVLLCKRNFGTFVETFNFLVDFAQNISGDGDANNNGIIVVDRTIPDRPIIRSKINYDHPFSNRGGSIANIPWKFEPGVGWHNCQLQVGFNCNIKGDVDDEYPRQITGCGKTADGDYYAKINLEDETATVETHSSGLPYISEYMSGIIWIYVGTVYEGVQTNGIYSIPVAYKFT